MLALAIFTAGVILQLLASILLARHGFGNGPQYSCSKCNATIHVVDGIYQPLHFFHLRHRNVLRVGDTYCQHQWFEDGGGAR
jgi:hypothetical protein